MSRQRSGTALPKQKESLLNDETRRRSGVITNLDLGFDPAGISFNVNTNEEAGEYSIYTKDQKDSPSNKKEDEIDSPLVSRKALRAQNIFKQFGRKRQKTSTSKFSEAVIEMSDSDYSFTSDNEEDIAELDVGVANKIIQKKIEDKYLGLEDDEEALELYKLCKSFTKEYIIEKKQIKTSSGKLLINYDMLDLIPEKKKVELENLSILKPKNLWKILKAQFGELTTFCINSDSSELAFGFKDNKIVILKQADMSFEEIKYKKVQHPVSCLEFYEENKLLIAGYQNGSIVYFQKTDQGKLTVYKKVAKYQETGASSILQILPIDGLNNFLIVDNDSKLIYGKKSGKKEFDKLKFHQVAEGGFQSTPNINIYNFFRRKVIVFCCGSTASIYVLKTGKSDPFIKIAQIGAPAGQKRSYESFSTLGSINYKKKKIFILSMIWGHNVSSYIIKPSKNGEVEIDFKDNLSLSEKVVYATPFSETKICFVTSKGSICLYSVQDHIETKKRIEEKEEKRRRGTITFNLVRNKILEKFKEDSIPAPPSASIPPAPALPSNSRSIKTMEINLSSAEDHVGNESHISNDSRSTVDEVKDFSGQKNKCLEKLESPVSKFVQKTSFSLNITELIEFAHSQKEFENFSVSRFMKSHDSQLFILNKDNLQMFEYKNWLNYINECIQNECYISALRCINEILDNKDLNLREIPDNFGELMKDLSPLLLLVITKIFPNLQENEENVNLMTNLSMFTLLKAGLNDYIATHLQVIMEAFGFKSQYLNNLRLFFEGGLVPMIEEGKIEQILDNMKNTPIKKKQFLNFLFKRKTHFREFALNYAKDSNETFYVYSSFCMSSVISNSGKPLECLLEKLKKTKSEKNALKSKEIIEKMIWYVYEVGLRTEKKYGMLDQKNQSFQVFKTFLRADLLKEVVNADTLYFLDCFKFLLIKNLAHQFSRHSTPLIDHKDPEDQKEGTLGEKSLDSESEANLISNKTEFQILDSTKSDLSIAFLFDKLNQFVNESNRFKFDFFLSELCLKSIEKVIISSKYIKKIFTAVVSQFHEITADPQVDMGEDDIVMLLFSIYTYNREIFEGDATIFNSLKEKSKKLMLIQYEMKKNQKATFALFQRLVTDNEQYKYELFNWLENGLKRPDDKQRMLHVIDEEYIYLIKICHKMYAKLLETLTIEEQMDYIMKYKPPTKSKLEIFKRILNFVKKKHMENEITNEFKVEYINLLNKHEKPKVLPELMTGKYPSSDCLQTCIDSKNHLAIAYIKERLGYYNEALDIYKSRLKKVFKSLTRGGRYKIRVKRERMLGRLAKESKMALDLCTDAENPEKFLFEYLEFVVNTTAKYKKWKVKEWTKMSEDLLDYILSTVPAKNFIKKIEDVEYPFVQDEYLMERTVNHFKELKGIFNATKKVNASDWWGSNNELILKIEPGKRTEVEDDPDAVGDCAMIFQNCDHSFECSQSEINGQPIYCSDCEDQLESQVAYNRLIRLWKREKHIFKPKNLVTKKKNDLNLFFTAFSSLNLLEMGKYKVNLDKWDREKKRINDFENYMSSEAVFSEIHSSTSIID